MIMREEDVNKGYRSSFTVNKSEDFYKVFSNRKFY